MKTPSALCAIALLASAPPAQETPRPAEQLQKFERLIGSWKGSGSVTMRPGAPPGKWTSTSRVRKTLGGHFLREDTRIDIEGEDAPGPLLFTSFYGYDENEERYVVYSINNMGTVDVAEVHWQDDDTMISTNATVYRGQPMIERWKTDLGEDSYEFVGEEAIGGGPFFVHAKGSVERVDEVPDFRAVDAAFLPPGTGVPEEMKRVCRMSGTYEMSGSVIVEPGAPPMEIGGTEVYEPIFGGTILVGEGRGDPAEQGVQYEGWYALGWDPDEKSYLGIALNNMGENHFLRARWSGDDALVFVHSGPVRGDLAVGRFVQQFDEDGVLSKGWSHGIHGAGEPVRDFEATYRKTR